jgi:lipopolysaccharide biosynthesis glycosyltransferase
MPVIHVACAFDKAMSVPAMVLAVRLKQLASPDRKTIFHALECEKDAFPTYAKYLLTSDSFGVRRPRVSIDTLRKYKLSIATVQSIATYGRLAIPQLIEEADRIMYLDCDILVKRPVGHLFDTDMRGFPLAACQDLAYLHFIRRHDGPARTSAMELLRDRRNYFNAGILLIDCVKWREGHFFEKIHALLANPPTPLFFADQDAVNVGIITSGSTRDGIPGRSQVPSRKARRIWRGSQSFVREIRGSFISSAPPNRGIRAHEFQLPSRILGWCQQNALHRSAHRTL